jgi:hypothetical protein
MIDLVIKAYIRQSTEKKSEMMLKTESRCPQRASEDTDVEHREEKPILQCSTQRGI